MVFFTDESTGVSFTSTEAMVVKALSGTKLASLQVAVRFDNTHEVICEKTTKTRQICWDPSDPGTHPVHWNSVHIRAMGNDPKKVDFDTALSIKEKWEVIESGMAKVFEIWKHENKTYLPDPFGEKYTACKCAIDQLYKNANAQIQLFQDASSKRKRDYDSFEIFLKSPSGENRQCMSCAPHDTGKDVIDEYFLNVHKQPPQGFQRLVLFHKGLPVDEGHTLKAQGIGPNTVLTSEIHKRVLVMKLFFNDCQPDDDSVIKIQETLTNELNVHTSADSNFIEIWGGVNRNKWFEVCQDACNANNVDFASCNVGYACEYKQVAPGPH